MMALRVFFVLLTLITIVNARGMAAASGGATKVASSRIPSRWKMWQTSPTKTANVKGEAKTTKKVAEPSSGPLDRLFRTFVVDVDMLPERWMALG